LTSLNNLRLLAWIFSAASAGPVIPTLLKDIPQDQTNPPRQAGKQNQTEDPSDTSTTTLSTGKYWQRLPPTTRTLHGIDTPTTHPINSDKFNPEDPPTQKKTPQQQYPLFTIPDKQNRPIKTISVK